MSEAAPVTSIAWDDVPVTTPLGTVTVSDIRGGLDTASSWSQGHLDGGLKFVEKQAQNLPAGDRFRLIAAANFTHTLLSGVAQIPSALAHPWETVKAPFIGAAQGVDHMLAINAIPAKDYIPAKLDQLANTSADDWARATGKTGATLMPTKFLPGAKFAPELKYADAPIAYGTPFKQLSKKGRSELLDMVDNRTITREDWARLQWHDRLTIRRQTGIDEFWAMERQNLTDGLPGSRNWSPEALDSILSGGRPSGIFGHHKYSVSHYPQLANDPYNIVPTTFNEHLYGWHGGNWRNASHGVPLNPSLAYEF